MNSTGFFEGLTTIRDVLNGPGPVAAQLASLLPLLEDDELRQQFFVELDAAEWVGPLREQGCFDSPPEPIEQDGGIAHPSWSASQYLVRMAAAAPKEVFETMAPIVTANARVILDIADAAQGLPGNLAARLASKVTDAIRGDVWIDLYAERAAGFIVKLAEDAELDAAITLADALFFLRPKKSISYGPVPRFGAHRYGELLPRVVQALGRANHERAMEWSCRLLRTAASFHQSPEVRDEFDDMSYIWRPAIEEHADNHGHDVADVVATAARDLTEWTVREGHCPLGRAVEFLEGYGKLILSRIALHLVRLFAEQDQALARERMLHKEYFDLYQHRHEYATLLKDRFGMLSPVDQSVILGWIEAGPDRDKTREMLRANLDDSFSEDLVERYVRVWQRDRLSWFSESLPDEWKQRYQQLVAELGQPELSDVVFRTTVGWGGGESPKTSAELAGMDTDALVTYLRSWRPDDPKDRMGPSIDSLADQFGAAVRENLDRFAAEAPAFSELQATYLSRLLHELGTAVRNKRQIPFGPAADLCLAVVSKPVELPTEHEAGGESPESDQPGEYARNAVADLVREMCGHDAPLALREKLWGCLAPLEGSPDRSYIVGGSEEDLRTATPIDDACNNPRAKVIGAVIRYAAWTKQRAIEASGEQDVGLEGMSAVPEAKEMLERHLRPNCPDSSAVHSQYGMHFPVLCWLDASWAETHKESIFPLVGDRAPRGWAAWNSYLVANQVQDHVFDILRGSYAQAIDELTSDLTDERSRFNPLRTLAEHMVILCGRGKLMVEEEDGLLRKFFRRAAPSIRAYGVEFAGRSLGEVEKLPEEVVPRFVSLWQWFWSEFGEGQSNAPPEQFAGFGWWLACGKFDAAWCLDRLTEVVEIAPVVEPEDKVMEWLGGLAQQHSDRVIQLADRMVRADETGWRLIGWGDELKSILRLALESGSADAESKAKALIDHLGRRGRLEYGELLQGE